MYCMPEDAAGHRDLHIYMYRPTLTYTTATLTTNIFSISLLTTPIHSKVNLTKENRIKFYFP